MSFIGEDNVKNLDAVKNLMDMGLKDPVYVFSGSKSGLDTLLPGRKGSRSRTAHRRPERQDQILREDIG